MSDQPPFKVLIVGGGCAALEAAFSPRTKAVLLNNPLNPAAKVFGDDELATLARLIVEHDAIAICDEVYEHIVFDGTHRPLMSYPGMRERTVRIGSAGKTLSLTGWKVGYATSPKALLDPIAKAHQFTTFTTPPNLQRAVAMGLSKGDELHPLLLCQARRGAGRGSGPAREIPSRGGGMTGADLLCDTLLVNGIDVSTTGYSSFQITEPNQPPRWRVSQTLVLEGSDFATLAGLVSKMQATDNLVLSSLTFTVSAATRRAAEDALTQQAIKNWQQRAQNAAQAFGSAAWRAGRITIQTNDYGRPQPMMRASVAAADVARAPVAVEGGMSEVMVTVSGEAILDTMRAGR